MESENEIRYKLELNDKEAIELINIVKPHFATLSEGLQIKLLATLFNKLKTMSDLDSILEAEKSLKTKYGSLAKKVIDGTANESRPMWVTKDGRSLPIAEMKDDHLLNAMRLIKMNTIKKVLSEDKYSKMGASKLLNRTKYHYLVDEAKRRGLI